MAPRLQSVGDAVAGGAVAAGPDGQVPSGTGTLPGRGWVVSTVGGVPEPVVLGGALLVGTVLWLAAMWLLAKVLYRLWGRVGGRVRWVVGVVLPESPLVKFATGVTLFLALVILIIGVLPTLVGDIGGSDEGPAGIAENLSDPSRTEFARDLLDRGLNGDWENIVNGDAIRTTGGSADGGGGTVVGEPVCRDRQIEGTDSDGDGLPDAWERAGETPSGAALPDADPAHKDVYLQVNYGSNVEPLTERERDQLRAVWARMPVGNPDGSTGIRLHVDASNGSAGGLGRDVVFTDRDQHAQFYTAEHMGDRLCVYHQVTYGRTELGATVGYGSMPGYASLVEGRRQPAYDGDVSFRVAVTTHELLHNVAGRVDGRAHTTRGWLAGGPDQEFLSEATAEELNEDGLFGPVH